MARRNLGRGAQRPPVRPRGRRDAPSQDEVRTEEWLYGRNAVRESLRAGRRRPQRLLIAEGADRGEVIAEIRNRAARAGAVVEETRRDDLDLVTEGANHQGVCLLTGRYEYVALPDLLAPPESGIYLVLDSLQDPQNLGTVLRTAEAVGVRGVVIPQHRAAQVTPAVVNASAGAVEHLRVAQVVNLVRSLGELKASGAWVIALENTPESVPLWETRLDGAVALVVGSEGGGIRRLVLEQCDVVASLPLLGHVESLNAAAAASVALYEALRQRR